MRNISRFGFLTQTHTAPVLILVCFSFIHSLVFRTETKKNVNRDVWLINRWCEEKPDFLIAAFLVDVRKPLNADRNQTDVSLTAPHYYGYFNHLIFNSADWLNYQLINKI